MDAEFGASMIYVTNRGQAGLRRPLLVASLGDAGINIATFHLGREAPGGDAIALVEIDGELPPRCWAGARAAAGAAGQAAAVLTRARPLRVATSDPADARIWPATWNNLRARSPRKAIAMIDPNTTISG